MKKILFFIGDLSCQAAACQRNGTIDVIFATYVKTTIVALCYITYRREDEILYKRNEVVQQMIDWLELHLTEEHILMNLAQKIGYSPYYCSNQFHAVVGMTMKRYIAGRKLGLAALAIRDTDQKLVDIALRYGFSSQQAFTRAFVYAFRCTPAAYRKNPVPIPIYLRKEVVFPESDRDKGEQIMMKTTLTEPTVRIVYIPAHKYIGIWDAAVQDYFSFWQRHNCDEVCGVIESMSHVMHPIVTCHTAGWFWEQGTRGYFYGFGVEEDFAGQIPPGFAVKEIPGSYYLAFSHPPFDFLKDCEPVINGVEDMAWNYDPAIMGFTWNEDLCQDYQKMMPETVGYEVLRPVKK